MGESTALPEGVKLTTHLYLVTNLRMNAAMQEQLCVTLYYIILYYIILYYIILYYIILYYIILTLRVLMSYIYIYIWSTHS